MRPSCALLPLLLFAGTPGPAVERINANDNTAPAGALKDGVLAIHLEIRMGEWHPDADSDAGVQVRAFAEGRSAPQIPGPLIRVQEGTEIRAFVRNATDTVMYLHGLYTRDAAAQQQSPIKIAAGGEAEVRFRAGLPGTYFYWASSSILPLGQRPDIDSQLMGALVIDPRGAAARDRIMMLSVWADARIAQLADLSRVRVRMTINGKSWPHTERYGYNLGDTIRWRIINASPAPHPMHLHGFYYRIGSRGGEAADTIYSQAEAPSAVTDRMPTGRTMTLSWVPERPGYWLFHCHDNIHIQPGLPLGDVAAKASTPAHVNHSEQFMAGLVIGVHVRTANGNMPPGSNEQRRRLRLLARQDTGSTATEPAFGYVLEEGTKQSPTVNMLPGPTIVLKRGEPVSITVVNQLPEATAVHWHGIELESYFDGVAGFAGQPGRIAPPVEPRDSFEARFTPPRAGTFIYHTHIDETRQQRAGLSGALVVYDPAAGFNPETNIVLLLSTPRKDSEGGTVYLNGTARPAARELQVGTPYRFRVINIHTFRPNMRIEVRQDTMLLNWRAVAKDGFDLPPARATVRPAIQQVSNGETYDFEYTPQTRGDVTVRILSQGNLVLAEMKLNVR